MPALLSVSGARRSLGVHRATQVSIFPDPAPPPGNNQARVAEPPGQRGSRGLFHHQVRRGIHHAIIEDQIRVLRDHIRDALDKQTVREMQYVGLVHGRDLLAAVTHSVIAGKPYDALARLAGDKLGRFRTPWFRLTLDTCVCVLRELTHEDDVQIAVWPRKFPGRCRLRVRLLLRA